jgi:hypothetical protein
VGEANRRRVCRNLKPRCTHLSRFVFAGGGRPASPFCSRVMLAALPRSVAMRELFEKESGTIPGASGAHTVSSKTPAGQRWTDSR